jgi:hypothetical protein
MADLKTDIVGQVARLPLKPNEGNALLPLFEAISNSLHAITERFGDKKIAEKGRIDIYVMRQETPDSEEVGNVEGFIIADNGIGLNEKNYKSFSTPFSQHKISKGGKGIGRLGWLKVFKSIRVDSCFLNETGLETRQFNFLLRDKDQIESVEPSDGLFSEPGTQVTLKEFVSEFVSRCPVKTETLLQRIIGHFLPVFAGEKSPKVVLHDEDGYFDLRDEFASKIVESDERLIEIELEGELQPIIIRHMRCEKSIRPRGGQNNWLCFCANDRGVKEYGIDEQIGLRLLEGEHIYVGAVTGDYLDKHVNPQRTDFIFESEDSKTIRRQVADSVREFLKEYVNQLLAQKMEITSQIIRKNPQYLYLNSSMDDFVAQLAANSNNEEKIHAEMSLHRYRRQRRFSGIKTEIEEASDFDQAISEKMEEYQQGIIEDQKGSLAEYVTKRKAVLGLLNKLRGFANSEDESQYLEDAVHKLICPMRVDSDSLEVEDHNLWILDDRLAFYRFFASDKTIKSFTDVDSAREPDLTFFYDSCIAWRENDKSCDTVILVEFKRPGLKTYNDKNDPFMQLMDYVTLFKSGNEVRDKQGNVITGIGPNTAFHCYIVADLTDGLRKRLRGSFENTPDGRGLFGYTKNPETYTEVIPYEKLLIDAQERNAVFFDKLGLNDA